MALLLALPLAAMAYVFLHATYLANQRLHPVRLQSPSPTDGPFVDVELKTSDGVPLHALYLPSRNGAAVVLAHGLGQDRTGLLPEGRILGGAGYGLLLLDLRAHGRSGGEISTWGERESLDVDAGVAFLRSQQGIDRNRVGALGFSIGADAVADSAARDPRLSAVALLAPSSTGTRDVSLDFDRWGPLSAWGALLALRLHGLHPGRIRTCEALRQIAPRPVLVIYGQMEHDLLMAPEVQTALPPGSTFWVVPGADHGGYLRAEPSAYPAALLSYFAAALR